MTEERQRTLEEIFSAEPKEQPPEYSPEVLFFGWLIAMVFGFIILFELFKRTGLPMLYRLLLFSLTYFIFFSYLASFIEELGKK